MGERGPKALDLSAREMPFLVTRFAYLISASRLTVVRWPPEQYKNLTETLGNINIFKFSIMKGTRPSVSEGFGMGSALP